jgi:hypothetical protein
VYVHPDGTFDVFLNRGPADNAYGWSWESHPQIGPANSGITQHNVVFGDVDGDGRDDVLVIQEDYSVDCHMNVGSYKSVTEIHWVPFPNTASAITPNIVLADINGDGRDDYLGFDADFGIIGFLNVRSHNFGSPAWAQQGGAKGIASGLYPGAYVNVVMGDMDGDGKDDYIVVNMNTSGIDVYFNRGSGDASVIGDSIRLADLDGDGIDDYIAVDAVGRVVAYINGGPGGSGTGWNFFAVNNRDFLTDGLGSAGHTIHFADINGDGKADYLAVNDKTGAVNCLINGGPRDSGWSWTSIGQIATGLGWAGQGVRFADIDGDGRADYLYVDGQGALRAFKNNGVGDNF